MEKRLCHCGVDGTNSWNRVVECQCGEVRTLTKKALVRDLPPKSSGDRTVGTRVGVPIRNSGCSGYRAVSQGGKFLGGIYCLLLGPPGGHVAVRGGG